MVSKMNRAVVCAVMAAVLLTGCGKAEESKDSSSKKGSSEAESSSTAETESDGNNYSIEQEIKPVFDEIIVNPEVEEAVEKAEPQQVNVEGYYSFQWENFGEVYSNEELENCFDRLEEIINNSYFDLAFSYQNAETGAYVGYNRYEEFMTCSTIKAPYIKSILADGANLAEIITRDKYWPGDQDDDDYVARMADGTEFTAKELMEYAIRKSDNTAYYLLEDKFGYMGFNNNLANIGANYRLGDTWIFTYSTADDMLKSYLDIYDYAEKDERGQWLVDLMSSTELDIQISQALGGKYKVAHKYGSEFNESVFNDCAIVYADSPFVLCIMTNQMPETEESCKVFKELAVVFDDINSLLAVQ